MNNAILAVIAIALLGYFMWRGQKTKKAALDNVKKAQAFLSENQQEQGVRTFGSGLQMLTLESGKGTENPSATDQVKVHYHGTLQDGTVFDSSVDRGQPITFGLNQVIPGWTEGLCNMIEGEKARLYIPSHLGYRNQKVGVIEPGSLLIFDVTLIAINP